MSAARRGSRWRSGHAKGDAEDQGVDFRYPFRNYELLLAARLPQQFAIASAHQSESALDETNGPIAQIVSFPGVLGNTFGAEQNFSDHAVTIAAHPRIECAKSQRQSLTPLGRQSVEWRTGRLAIERAP